MRKVLQYIHRVLVLGVLVSLVAPSVAFSGTLLQFKDVLSNSGPSMMSQHTIEFTPTNDIPSSGLILIALDPEFNIPASFNYTDIDLATMASSGAPFVDRDLASSSAAVVDGVSVLTGTSSLITIELGSSPSNAIAAGERIQIELGTNARHGTIGDQLIINPENEGTYRVDVETQTLGGVHIDGWNTLVALVRQVGLGPINTVDDSAPVISNVLPPYGLLIAGGTTNIQVALNTSENATCRWSDTQGTPYVSMTNFFDQTYDYLHTITLTGLVDDTTYDMYIVCADAQNNYSTEYHEQFAIGVIPLEPGTGGLIGPPGETGDGVGGGNYDFGGPYLGNARVVLDGRAYPGSSVTVLRDGEFEKKLTAGSSGSFNTAVENLVRGTYTFGVYAEDSEGRRSATYNTTISINAETGNTISRIYVPPTIDVNETTLNPGATLSVFGFAVPESEVEVFLGKQVRIGSDGVITATTSVSTAGIWSVDFDTSSLSLETYEVKARVIVPGEDPGDFSASVFVGVGGDPQPDYSLRADLNKDGSVNIIDFSILLFNWGTDDPIADINLDGRVDLTDFSIMLFYWTG